MSPPSIVYVVFLLIASSTANPVNQSVCILPSGQALTLSSQQLAQLQQSPGKGSAAQPRTEQQQQEVQAEQALIDATTTTTLPPSSLFRSPSDQQQPDRQPDGGRGQQQQQQQQRFPGGAKTTQKSLNPTPRPGSQQQQQSPATAGRSNFWNVPINKTTADNIGSTGGRGKPSSRLPGYDSSVLPDEQQRQVPVQSFDRSLERPGSSEGRPLSPIYDRSGFRREPLHPAFGQQQLQPSGQQKVPSLLPPDQAIYRSPQAGRGAPGSWNRFSTTPPDTTSSPFEVTPLSPSFFDPTRKPKTGRDGTTRRPFFEQTPGLTREFSTPRTPADARSRQQSTSPQTGATDPAGVQTVPEYAYIKQPISKVLDEPDLELEGKPVKFGIMKDALDRVGLLELTEGTSPVTIFCPTDDAFLTLDPETLTKMQQNPNYLRNTMLRHIVNFDVPPESLKNDIVIPSYSGEPLIINIASGGKLMMVRGAPIIAATNAQNGVIYVISKVMTDETKSGTIIEELGSRPELSTFFSYLSRSPVSRRLQGQGPFTVFAPNNSAFDQLSPVTRQVLDFNPVAVDKLLNFHIIEGAHYSKELETLDNVPPSETRPEPIKLRALPDGSVSINDVGGISRPDVTTGNGVVHVIDSLIIPNELLSTFRKLESRSGWTRNNSPASPFQADQPRSSNVSPFVKPQFSRRDSRTQPFTPEGRTAGLAVSNRNPFNPVQDELYRKAEKEAPRAGEEDQETTVRFYRWLQKSGFLDVLNNTGNNYTVILPADKAVNRLPNKYQKALEDNPRQLESLLMYHIIPGAVNMTRLKDEEGIPTVSGRNVRVSIYPSHKRDGKNTTSLSGAQVIGDSKTPNGKVRFLIVDRVMYPPQGNLFDVISRSPILKSLSNLIKVANLETGLSDTGPFTLFAPSDEAFLKLPPESLDYLSHDPQSSRAFLLRHIVRPVIFTSSIPLNNSTVLESTTGERLELSRSKDVVKVDGVAVKYADITATNGVIHVIDHVL